MGRVKNNEPAAAAKGGHGCDECHRPLRTDWAGYPCSVCGHHFCERASCGAFTGMDSVLWKHGIRFVCATCDRCSGLARADYALLLDRAKEVHRDWKTLSLAEGSPGA